MKKYLNRILIIDGSYVMHRSLKTPALEELTTSTGMKSGGVFGALRIIQSEMKKFPTYFPIVCFDKGLSERRKSLFPDYKANRQRQQADTMIANSILVEENNYLEEYHRQRNDLMEILKAFGIPSLIIPGWEGDDLQYLLSTVCNEGVVVSDDKDMIQLVSPTVKIDRSMRKEIIDWNSSDVKYRHPRYTIAKSIVGDGSDNIPQVASGVGDVTADTIAQYLQRSEDLDEQKKLIQEFIDNEENKQSLRTKAQKVLDNWDQYVINYQLINLRLVEPPIGFEEMIKRLILSVAGKPNLMRVYPLLGRYELSSIHPDQIISLLAVSSVNVILKEGE